VAATGERTSAQAAPPLEPPSPFAASLRQLEALHAQPSVVAGVRSHMAIFAAYCGLPGVTTPAAPWVGRGEDGSIGLDWRHEGRRLAVTFDVNDGVEFFATDARFEKVGDITDARGHPGCGGGRRDPASLGGILQCSSGRGTAPLQRLEGTVVNGHHRTVGWKRFVAFAVAGRGQCCPAGRRAFAMRVRWTRRRSRLRVVPNSAVVRLPGRRPRRANGCPSTHLRPHLHRAFRKILAAHP
jgi:hypothetical protein